MKFFLAVVALAALAAAKPQEQGISFDPSRDVIAPMYNDYGVPTSNGIISQEGLDAISAQSQITYTDYEGNQFQYTRLSNRVLIQGALQYIAEHPQPVEKKN